MTFFIQSFVVKVEKVTMSQQSPTVDVWHLENKRESVCVYACLAQTKKKTREKIETVKRRVA